MIPAPPASYTTWLRGTFANSRLCGWRMKRPARRFNPRQSCTKRTCVSSRTLEANVERTHGPIVVISSRLRRKRWSKSSWISRAGKNSAKRGGDKQRLPLEEFHRVTESPLDLLDLDDALTRFAVEEPDKARLVHLALFHGPLHSRGGCRTGDILTPPRKLVDLRAGLADPCPAGQQHAPRDRRARISGE